MRAGSTAFWCRKSVFLSIFCTHFRVQFLRDIQTAFYGDKRGVEYNHSTRSVAKPFHVPGGFHLNERNIISKSLSLHSRNLIRITKNYLDSYEVFRGGYCAMQCITTACATIVFSLV